MPKNSVIIKRIERDQVQKRDFDLVDYDDETALMMMMRERYNGEIIFFIVWCCRMPFPRKIDFYTIVHIITQYFSLLSPTYPPNLPSLLPLPSGDLAFVRDVFFVLGDIVDVVTRELQKVRT